MAQRPRLASYIASSSDRSCPRSSRRGARLLATAKSVLTGAPVGLAPPPPAHHRQPRRGRRCREHRRAGSCCSTRPPSGFCRSGSWTFRCPSGVRSTADLQARHGEPVSGRRAAARTIAARRGGRRLRDLHPQERRSRRRLDQRQQPARLQTATATSLGGVVTFRDITDQKHQLERQQLLSKIVEDTADAVLVTDSAGNIEYVNAAFEQMTGIHPGRGAGQEPEAPQVRPSLQRRSTTNCWETLLRGEVFRDTITDRRKSGEIYLSSQTITPLKSPDGDASRTWCPSRGT